MLYRQCPAGMICGQSVRAGDERHGVAAVAIDNQ
jgi:hypothetical protein